MRLRKLLALCCFLVFMSGMNAQKYTNTQDKEVTKDWKGTTFTSAKSFSENIATSTSFSFLKTILENEMLSEVISEEEMVTFFAPSDAAFLEIEETSRDSLLTNSVALSGILKLHMVPGRLDAYSIKKAIEKNKGTAYFATLGGEKLGARMNGENIVIFDAENREATIREANFYHKNGFFHIVDGLLKPSEDQ